MTISCTGLLPSLAAFSKALLLSSTLLNAGPQPRRACSPVWPLSRSLAATQEIIIYFLFLRVLRCFSSPGARHKAMNSLYGSQTLLWLGSPIRISADHNLFAVPRSFSQLTTSFIGYHVLHRRMVPWHPPCALCSLIFSSLDPETNRFLSSSLDSERSKLKWLLRFPSEPNTPFSEASSFLSSSANWPLFKIILCAVVKIQCPFMKEWSGSQWTRTTDLSLIRRVL